jgi:hypothetical protein
LGYPRQNYRLHRHPRRIVMATHRPYQENKPIIYWAKYPPSTL